MRAAVVAAATVLGLSGCAMVEYGTVSHGANPLVTPFNAAENGWKPWPASTYHGDKNKPAPAPDPDRDEPSARWHCGATAECTCDGGKSFYVHHSGYGATKKAAQSEAHHNLIGACINACYGPDNKGQPMKTMGDATYDCGRL